MALHCPECGFVNAEGANYCQTLRRVPRRAPSEPRGEPTTATYRIDETGELVPVELEDVVAARARRSSSAPAAAASARASRSTASA